MATTEFQLVDNRTFLPADVIGEDIFVSPEQSNGTGTGLSTGIQVVMHYHDFQSSGGTELQAVLEGKSSQGRFYTIAHQFEGFKLIGVQQTRRIVMAPDLGGIEPGPSKDDKTTVGGVVIDQISRQYGTMPSIWRVRVCIRSAASLVSVRMSIYGHRFNQLIPAVGAESVVTDVEGRSITDAGSVVTV